MFWDNENNIAILSSLALIKPINDKIQPEYLKHFMDSSMNQSWLKRLMGGTALQRIILRDIRKLTVCFPKLSEQKKILRTDQGATVPAKNRHLEKSANKGWHP